MNGEPKCSDDILYGQITDLLDTLRQFWGDDKIQEMKQTFDFLHYNHLIDLEKVHSALIDTFIKLIINNQLSASDELVPSPEPVEVENPFEGVKAFVAEISKSVTLKTFLESVSDETPGYVKLSDRFKMPAESFVVSATPKENMFTPCQYNTFMSSDFKIISPHYQYANLIEGVGMCSHPEIAAHANGVSFCTMMHDQSSCAKYGYEVHVLAETTVQRLNSDKEQILQLSYAPMINFFESYFAHVFSIRDVTTNSVVNQIAVPQSEVTYEDAVHEAMIIFEEYVSAFASDETVTSRNTETVSVGELPAAHTPQPYFAQILSLT